ncbi:MAG TPA: hypothetical protein GX013_00825 [Propionibacterium sp.]|nr:hypothetical protein [Propionibacterium sp.]
MTQPGGQPTPTDDWKAVSPAQPPEGSTPPMPPWVKPVLALTVAALMLLAGVIGARLGTPDPPEPTPTPSPTPSPAFPMEPPVMVDRYVRGQSNNGDETSDLRIAQADYTDGEDTVVFVMTWPETDVTTFLTNAGISTASETARESGRYCGLSEDTGEVACGEVVHEVGLLLVSVTDQSRATISATLDRFKEELGQ